MSKKEFDRLEVLLGVQSGRLRVANARELLSLKRRQVFRLLAGLKHGGATSLVSKRRGRPSNNRLPEAYRDLALSLVRERYVVRRASQASQPPFRVIEVGSQSRCGSVAEEPMVCRLTAGGRWIRTCMGLSLSSGVFRFIASSLFGG